MKKIWENNIGKTIVILLSGILIGVILIIGSFLLPMGRIEKNVEKSVAVLERETKYYEIIEGDMATKLDNYTDAIMLSNAIYGGAENILDKSMHVYRYALEEVDSVASLKNHFTHDQSAIKVSYGRYWHGYLVILKPVLLLFDYANIRVLNSLLQPMLVALVAILMYKKKKDKYILPYLVSILMVSPFTVMQSLQYSSIFYISNISLIVLLLLNERLKTNNSYIYYFMIVGMVTSYIDFLTYPLAALGMPLVMYFILREENDLWKNIKDFFMNCIWWSIGYIGMWVGKFAVGSLLTGDNLFSSAFDAFETRVSNEAQMTTLTPMLVIRRNLNIIINKPHLLLIMAVIIYFIYKFIKEKNDINKYTFYRLIPYVLIACIPFAWFTIASNHSYIHSFFTYRILIVSVFAFLAGVMSIIEKERISSNENKKEGTKKRSTRKGTNRQ